MLINIYNKFRKGLFVGKDDVFPPCMHHSCYDMNWESEALFQCGPESKITCESPEGECNFFSLCHLIIVVELSSAPAVSSNSGRLSKINDFFLMRVNIGG